MVAAGRHQVRAVGAEGAVPHPALMALQGRLERERLAGAAAAHRSSDATAAHAHAAKAGRSGVPEGAAAKLGALLEGGSAAAAAVGVVAIDAIVDVVAICIVRRRCRRHHRALVGRRGSAAAALRRRVRVYVHLPDFCRVVGAARRELLDVRREKDSRDVFLVRGELGNRDELGAFVGLDQGPDEDVALRVVDRVLARVAMNV